MHSKNKPAQTKAEREYVALVAQLPCVVCDDTDPVEIHEPEQGLWHASMPLCFLCHRGKDGWHGTRLRWKLRRMDELKAINKTVAGVFTRLLETA